MRNNNTGIKRLVAGALAALLILTAFPQTSIEAFAKQDASGSFAIEEAAAESSAIIAEEPAEEAVQIPSSEKLSVSPVNESSDPTASDPTDSDPSYSDVIDSDATVSDASVPSVSESDTADVAANDAVEADNEGERFQVMVERGTNSRIKSFVYSVKDGNGDDVVTTKTATFGENQSYVYITDGLDINDPAITSGYTIYISSIEVSENQLIALADGQFVTNTSIYEKTITKAGRVELTTEDITITDAKVNIPTRSGITTVSMVGDGTQSVTIEDTIYAYNKMPTIVTMSLASSDDYDLEWDGAPTASYTTSGTGTVNFTSTDDFVASKSGNTYSCTLTLKAVREAISAGASTIQITPHVKAYHKVKLMLADDAVSSGLTNAEYIYKVWNPDGTVFYTNPKTLLYPRSNPSVPSIKVPDGGYITVEKVNPKDPNVYFESATISDDSTESNATSTFDASGDDFDECLIKPTNGVAYHGNITMKFANYNYKIWQGNDAKRAGEKKFIYVTNERNKPGSSKSYDVSFVSGVYDADPVFPSDEFGGYYAGRDMAHRDVVFTFNSQDIIQDVTLAYKKTNALGDVTTTQMSNGVYTPGDGHLVAPSGGVGIYTCTIPASVVGEIKDSIDSGTYDVLTITINKVPTYVVTMKVDGNDASKSKHANIEVFDSSENTKRLNDKADSFVVTTGTQIRVRSTLKQILDDKPLKFGIEKIIVKREGEADAETVYDPYDNPPDFDYTITSDTTIDIITKNLTFFSYKEGTSPVAYNAGTVGNPAGEGEEVATINYETPLVVKYLMFDDAAGSGADVNQIITGDYEIYVDGTKLTDSTTPKLREVAELSFDGDYLTLDFSQIPGKKVKVVMGGVHSESTLAKKSITFKASAIRTYKLTLKFGNELASVSQKASTVVMTGTGSSAKTITPGTDGIYLIDVDSTDLHFTNTITNANKFKFGTVKINGVTSSITTPAAFDYTVTGDDEIQIGIKDLPNLTYKNLATSVETNIKGSDNDPAGLINVVYTDRFSIRGDLGDIPQEVGETGNFDIYVGDSGSTPTKLTTPAQPGFPALSDVVDYDETSSTELVIKSLVKCASTDTEREVKVVFADNGEFTGRQIIFKIARIPQYRITLNVNGETPSAASFATVEILDITESGTGTAITPDSGSTNVFTVPEGAKVRITSAVSTTPEDYSKKYELSSVKKNGSADSSLTPASFEYTVNASTTQPASTVTDNIYGSVSFDIITKEKSYIEYTFKDADNDDPDPVAEIAKAEDSHNYPAGATPDPAEVNYNDTASLQYYFGKDKKDLTGEFSVKIGDSLAAAKTAASLSATSEPALSDVITVKDGDNTTLNLKFDKIADPVKDMYAVIQIAGVRDRTLTPKYLYYKISPLPKHKVTVTLSGTATSAEDIADITVTDDKGKTYTASSFGVFDDVPEASVLTIKTTIKDAYKYKYELTDIVTSSVPSDPGLDTSGEFDPAEFNYTVYGVTDNPPANSVTITIAAGPLSNLLYKYPHDSTTGVILEGKTISAGRIQSVNYDRKASLQYFRGETPKSLTGAVSIYVEDSVEAAEQSTQALDETTTPKLSEVASISGSELIIDFKKCPSKTVRVTFGTGAADFPNREVYFNVSNLRSHDITLKVDGKPYSEKTSHAKFTVTKEDEEVSVDTNGKCVISERDTIKISYEIADEIKYAFDHLEVTEGTADPVETEITTPTEYSFEYTVKEGEGAAADAVINIVTIGLNYLEYTYGAESGHLKGETASSAGDASFNYTTRNVTLMYMIGDDIQKLTMNDVQISMVSIAGGSKVLVDEEDPEGIYPMKKDVVSLKQDGSTLVFDFSSKMCRDHLFKIVLGDGDKLIKREITFNVLVEYTINTGGENDVIAVSDITHRSNIRLISGMIPTGETVMHSGIYNKAATPDVVFAICDSIYSSADEIRKVSYLIEGKLPVELRPDEKGYYTVARNILEQFITYNKKVTIELTVEPAVYETSLKLAKGSDYAKTFYNTDEALYKDVAYPVWNNITTARKFEKVVLLDPDGREIARYDTETKESGIWSGAINFSASTYGDLSIGFKPGTVRPETVSGVTTYYHMPAGKYKIVAYASEPSGMEVTGTMTVNLGQGITDLGVDASTGYLYKKPGKEASVKASAQYSGADRYTEAGSVKTYINSIDPTTKSVEWYVGNASGAELSYSDAFYGAVTVKNGTFTVNKKCNETGEFYIWGKANDYAGNPVKAGTRVVVSMVPLTFDTVKIEGTGQTITAGGSYQAPQIFSNSIVVNGTELAYDRIRLYKNGEDVTSSFTIKVSGGAKQADKYGGMTFAKAGQVTVIAVANDGSKNRVTRKFSIVYGNGDLGYTITNDRNDLRNVALINHSGTYENRMPASEGLHLSVYGTSTSGNALIANKITVKGGQIKSRTEHIRSTEYSIVPISDITVISITNTGSGRTQNIPIQNKAITTGGKYKLVPYNRNPVTGKNNDGKIFCYINYRDTWTGDNALLDSAGVFFEKYEDSHCNRVEYTVKGPDRKYERNVVLLETPSSYIGEVFEANGFQMVNVAADKSGVYATEIENGKFVIDYSVDPDGYLDIPKGNYKITVTAGYAAPYGTTIDMNTYNAYSAPIDLRVTATKAPGGKVKVSKDAKFGKHGMYGDIKFEKKSGIIKGTATFDLKHIYGYDGKGHITTMASLHPLKGINKKGTINTFAYDYDITEINLKGRLSFTGKGSAWLVKNGTVSAKDANRYNMLNGYVPFAYQKADGTVVYEYAPVTVKASNGLNVYE